MIKDEDPKYILNSYKLIYKRPTPLLPTNKNLNIYFSGDNINNITYEKVLRLTGNQENTN